MTTSFRDAERLSAYLDGQLQPSEAARLEARLASDPELGALLQELRQARSVLRRLPARRAPRNFILRPGMPGLRAPLPRAYPFLRLASVAAMVMFLSTFLINTLSPQPVTLAAYKAAPACEQCGGGSAMASQAAPTPAAEPLIQPFAAAPLPSPTAESILEATPEPAPAALPEGERATPLALQKEAPVPPVWQAALGGMAFLSGAVLWWMRASAERRFHRQWSQK